MRGGVSGPIIRAAHTGGSDDETAAEAEPGRSAMAEPDAVSDASDSDSEASNDEDGWSCDEEHGEVAYE